MNYFLVKTLLKIAPATVFQNVGVQNVVATHIHLSNLTGAEVKVSLSFTREGENPLTGAILNEYPLLANSTTNIRDRVLQADDIIIASCDTDDGVALSIDIEGVTANERTVPPLS